MATQQDIATDALVLAGITDRYNAPDATTLQDALTKLADLHEEWVDDQMVEWELAAIPVRATNAVKQLLAYRLGQDYQVPNDIYSRLQVDAVGAEQALHRQKSIPYNGEPVQADYF